MEGKAGRASVRGWLEVKQNVWNEGKELLGTEMRTLRWAVTKQNIPPATLSYNRILPPAALSYMGLENHHFFALDCLCCLWILFSLKEPFVASVRAYAYGHRVFAPSIRRCSGG